MSSNGNIFRVTGHLCGEFPGDRWIPRWPVNSPHKGQWRGALTFSLICAWINCWVNNGEAGDLRRHHAHYDVMVMVLFWWKFAVASEFPHFPPLVALSDIVFVVSLNKLSSCKLQIIRVFLNNLYVFYWYLKLSFIIRNSTLHFDILLSFLYHVNDVLYVLTDKASVFWCFNSTEYMRHGFDYC